MHESRIAAPYAKSLLELSQETGSLDIVYKDMLLFAKVCEENRMLVTVLKNPTIDHSKKLDILVNIFKGRVNDLTMKMFEILAKKNREAFLYDIALEFAKQYLTYKGIASAELTTTFTLTDSMRLEFINMVASAEGKKVQLIEKLDEAIIGGYILKVGDKQIDESIRAKLQRLKSEFKDNPYIPKY